MLQTLQKLCFPEKGICETAELYYHCPDSRTIDLDGYFNLFYIEKRRFFTAIEGLRAEMTLRGFARAVLMHDREEIGGISLEARETKDYVLTFPYDRYERGLFWIRLIRDPAIPEQEQILRGCYVGVPAPEQMPRAQERTADGKETAPLRDIRIAAAICTYQRESYVLRNLRKILQYGQTHPETAAHYHFFVIDNGRTLSGREDFRALLADAAGSIELIEHRNTGGTGGFTRAMEEAMRRKEELGLTHLMLLDDDAVFDPELFLRMYALLATLKEEYRDITVGGAMWRVDTPYIQYTSGEWFRHLNTGTPQPLLDLREYANCASPGMTEADAHSGLYSGWWCCCYSMAVVREENLPLPLFIRGDDTQFGLKTAAQGILFLGGIGVWHQGFELVFPGLKKYYNVRNLLMTSAIFEPELNRREAILWIARQIVGLLLTFRYAEMRLACRGAEDFLRGPDWLDGIDGEKFNDALSAWYREQAPMRPLSELLEKERYAAFAERYLSEEALVRLAFQFSGRHEEKGGLKKLLTLNGWLLPAKKETGTFCTVDSPWKLYRCGRVLLYEPEAQKGRLVLRDRRQLLTAAGMLIRLTARMWLRYPSVARAYRRRAGL